MRVGVVAAFPIALFMGPGLRGDDYFA